jgi:GNAT superfamily N-acetyltransferase
MQCHIEQAAPHEAPLAMEVIGLCREQMRASGSDQWNDLYPRLEIVQADANAGALYLLRDDEVCIGAVCLNEVQPAEYAALPWRYNPARILVVHRLCVLPERQGRDAARQLMSFAGALALREGYGAIRLDTYTGNPRAVALYVLLGYEKTGQVIFPARRLPFDCFETRIGT